MNLDLVLLLLLRKAADGNTECVDCRARRVQVLVMRRTHCYTYSHYTDPGIS